MKTIPLDSCIPPDELAALEKKSRSNPNTPWCMSSHTVPELIEEWSSRAMTLRGMAANGHASKDCIGRAQGYEICAEMLRQVLAVPKP